MSNWFAYDDGRSIGSVGAEGGEILRDEEHEAGARVTLKRGSSYVSVSCNVYGWMDHTRFFGSVTEAQREYMLMKPSSGKYGRKYFIGRQKRSQNVGSDCRICQAVSIMLKALIFDFDGLILDTETPEVLVWQSIYREHGFELPVDEWAEDDRRIRHLEL